MHHRYMKAFIATVTAILMGMSFAACSSEPEVSLTDEQRKQLEQEVQEHVDRIIANAPEAASTTRATAAGNTTNTTAESQ